MEKARNKLEQGTEPSAVLLNRRAKQQNKENYYNQSTGYREWITNCLISGLKGTTSAVAHAGEKEITLCLPKVRGASRYKGGVDQL